jgi:spermidine/putrescine transport system permease protein
MEGINMLNASERIRWYPGFREIALLCLVILYAPLIIVMIYSFNDSPSITVWKGFSFVWYEEVFTGPEAERFKQATVNSLIIAVSAAITSTANRHHIGISHDPWSAVFADKAMTFGLINLPLMVPGNRYRCCYSYLFCLNRF